MGEYSIGNNENPFDIENAFYQSASIARIGKFATHLDLFRRISSLPGEIVECGVFKGTSLFRWIKFRALLENAFSRRIVAFDTFGKFPEAGFEDDRECRDRFVAAAGDESIRRAALVDILQQQMLFENIELIEGDLCQTIPEFIAANTQLKIAMLHVDVDLFEPTAACLTHLYPHVVRGGVIILDDYGAFPGANKAIDEFFSEMPVSVQKLAYSSNIAFVVKP